MTPVVKTLLIVAGAISFVLLILLRVAPGTAEQLLLIGALTPDRVLHQGWVWQVFTYLFIHVEPFHLLFNLLGLWLLGAPFERLWGPRSLLKFLAIAGIGAGICVVLAGWATGTGERPTIGMSGALNGLLMAFALNFPEQPIYFYGLFPIKGKHLVGIVVVLEVLFALAGSTASLPAHLGGLLTGYFLVTGNWRPSRLYRKLRPTRPKRPNHLKVIRDEDDDPPRYLH